MAQEVHVTLKHRISNYKTREAVYQSCLSCHFYEVYLRKNNFSDFAVARVEVVINEAGGLEEGVADCCAEEFEASAFHVFCYCIRFW